MVNINIPEKSILLVSDIFVFFSVVNPAINMKIVIGMLI